MLFQQALSQKMEEGRKREEMEEERENERQKEREGREKKQIGGGNSSVQHFIGN